MKIPTRLIQTLSIAALTLPFNAFADSWSCRHGDDVREIHIQRATSAPVPCSVVYKKLTEGVEDQVLWTAENDANFCDEKARAFVEKQAGWGWTCVETIQTMSGDTTNTAAEEAPQAEEAAPAEESSQPQ
ncbi:MAG TPA: hypothetical protein VIQ03_03150 [Gammaproteobacteria bacterium]